MDAIKRIAGLRKLLRQYEECPRGHFSSNAAYIFQRLKVLYIIAQLEEW